MPEVTVKIGGHDFEVACQEGEEHFLQSAAAMLDAEASVLTSQIGRLPQPRMLLMAGLMLADKTAGGEEQLRAAEQKIAELELQLVKWRSVPKPEPERVEVPVVPDTVSESMAEIAARAEAIAAKVEERAGGAP